MWDLIEDEYSEEYKIEQVITLQSCIGYLALTFLFIIQSILSLSLLLP